MDYSAANPGMWNFVIQLGAIALSVLAANILRRRVSFIKNSLMPVAVLAGFILLFLKVCGIFAACYTIRDYSTLCPKCQSKSDKNS